MGARRTLATLLALAVASLGCAEPTRAPPDAAAASTLAPVAATSPVAPVASTSPVAPAVGVGACPLAIRPGRSLGPIPLGATVASLAGTGLAVSKVHESGTTVIAHVGPYRVSACGGVVREVWLDDLREAPDCATVAGAKVDRKISREAFTRLFAACHDTPPRIGGAFTECEKGGLRIGYGMGDFLQVRVAREGSSLDEECADVLDDGKPVALPSAELAKLLQRTLDDPKLAPFWHRDRPNRDPLRVVRLASGEAPPLTMFASPVVWIDAKQAKDGKPSFEFTRIDGTARRVVIAFRYPAEGVIGSVTFARRFDRWDVESSSVAER